MPQSLAAVLIHIVFSTKDRRPFLTDPALRLKIHSYITGIYAKQDSPCLQIGGMPDHLHLRRSKALKAQENTGIDVPSGWDEVKR